MTNLLHFSVFKRLKDQGAVLYKYLLTNIAGPTEKLRIGDGYSKKMLFIPPPSDESELLVLSVLSHEDVLKIGLF